MLLNILVISIITVLILSSFFFVFLPLIPGIVLTWFAAGVYILWKGFPALGWPALIWMLAMGVLYFLVDWFGGIIGAKKFGASKFGMLGSIFGGLFGAIFGGVFGIIIGTLIGTAAFELIFDTKTIHQAFRAGYGAALGFLIGSLGKFILVLIATIIFLTKVFTG